jgi:hypothetical protein
VRTLNRSKTLIKPLLIAAGVATAVAAPARASELPDSAVSAGNAAAAAPATDRAVDPESAARAQWRKLMSHNSTPATGCFHASYPNIVWERVACGIGQPRANPVHIKPRGDEPEVTGGILGTDKSNDYVAQSKGLITGAYGFFATSGVTSEVGVYEYTVNGIPQGILGPNEYSIQLNTNELETTSACAGRSGCHVWQQFVYATDYVGQGVADVFMQYWLLDWNSTCPAGWNPPTGTSTNCWVNSYLAVAPDVPITDLGYVEFAGYATAGGNDQAVFTYDSEAYSTSFRDNFLDISSVWNKAEFNVVGNGGGSRANFNAGSSIMVSLYLLDGSTSAPTCVANDGTTGESNNLNLGACKASGGYPPYIRFTESN